MRRIECARAIPKRGDIWLVELDPTRGSEIQKTRPCLVVSVDSMSALQTRIVVPITEWKATHAHYFTRVSIAACATNGLTKDSAADVAQVRTVSLERFRRRPGRVTATELADAAAASAMAVGAL